LFSLAIFGPTFLIYITVRHLKKENYLANPEKRRFQAIFFDLDLDIGPKVLIHPIFFLLRRLILALVVVTMRNVLFMQICL
jgi:hypothetical protein